MESVAALRSHVEGLVAPHGPFLNAGLVLQQNNRTLAQFAFGALRPGRPSPFELSTPLRFASVSKTVTARAVIALALRGDLDLDDPVTACLDLPLASGVTTRRLLSHTGGVSDAAGYLIDPPDTLGAFVRRNLTQLSSAVDRFSYSNLSYILLGAMIERVTKRRFDEAVNELALNPLGIEGRFAWVGMSPENRNRAAPIVRRESGGFSVQIDGSVPAFGLYDRHGGALDLSTYVLCEDTAFFGPHAGLRMTLYDAAKLARTLLDPSDETVTQTGPLWRHDPEADNGDTVDGLFTGYGAGVQVHPPSSWFGSELVGHFGNAYGLACGVWADRGRNASFAFTLNGMPHRRAAVDREAFYSEAERCLFKAIDRALA